MSRWVHKYADSLIEMPNGLWYVNDCNPGGGCTTVVTDASQVGNDGNVGDVHPDWFANVGGQVIAFGTQSYTLAGNERCRNVRINVWGGAAFADGEVSNADIWLRVGSGGLGKGDSAFANIAQVSSRSWYSPYSNTGEFTQAQMDNCEVYIRDNAAYPNHVAIGAVNLDYEIMTQPTASVSGPSGTGNTLNPTVTWSANYQGDSSRSYNVRVRRVSDNAVVYDSGTLSGAPTSFVIPSGLANGTQYIADVRVSTDISGADFWSNYASGPAFTTFQQPVATATGPTGVGNSLTPTVTWTNDFKNNTARAYQIQVLQGGTLVWDSGRIAGSATSRAVGTTLALNTTYTAQVRIANDLSGGDEWSAYSGVSFTTGTAASCTVTGPSGVITTTNQPTITWTYSGTPGQDKYRVKIFTSTDYTDPSFNPDTWPTVWDSGDVSGAGTSQLVALALSTAPTYKAYVRVSNSVAGFGAWSSGSTFTVTATGVDKPARAFFVPTNANGSAGPGYYSFDDTDRGGTFTWKSAPFRTQDGKQIEIREVQVYCRSYDAGATIAVTVGQSTRIVTLPTPGRHQLSVRFAEHAEMLDVQVVSSAGTPATNEAPSLETVRIGWRSLHTLRYR